MRSGPRSSQQAYAWTGLAGLLAAMAVVIWRVQHHDAAVASLLEWHRASPPHEVWRNWTSAGLHWSMWHLGANLAGCLALVVWGRACALGTGPTVAWLLAWPLTQASLWLTADLQHYGGLSGVLHAGVAIGATQLLIRRSRAERELGIWVMTGLACKLVLETPSPLSAALHAVDPLDVSGYAGFSVAYQVHWAGSLAGVACAALVHRLGGGGTSASPPATKEINSR